MEAKVILIGLILLLCSCNNMQIPKQTVRIQDQWHVGLKDTVLKESLDKSFILFDFQGDTSYSVEWGNRTIRNKTIKSFDVLGNGILGITESDENTIVLGQSCGTSCLYLVVLPLRKNAQEKVYYFVKAYDIRNSLVAFIPEGDNTFIKVENFITGQSMEISEGDLCPAGFKGDCIDTVFFDKSNLVIKWQGKKWEIDKPDSKEKTIQIII